MEDLAPGVGPRFVYYYSLLLVGYSQHEVGYRTLLETTTNHKHRIVVNWKLNPAVQIKFHAAIVFASTYHADQNM